MHLVLITPSIQFYDKEPDYKPNPSKDVEEYECTVFHNKLFYQTLSWELLKSPPDFTRLYGMCSKLHFMFNIVCTNVPQRIFDQEKSKFLKKDFSSMEDFGAHFQAMIEIFIIPLQQHYYCDHCNVADTKSFIQKIEKFRECKRTKTLKILQENGESEAALYEKTQDIRVLSELAKFLMEALRLMRILCVNHIMKKLDMSVRMHYPSAVKDFQALFKVCCCCYWCG